MNGAGERRALLSRNFHGEAWHSVEGRRIREVIFGVNDGLITAFGFVAGVSGAQVLPVLVFLTGLAQAVAGAISMFFGSYLSNKAQREFYEREIEREIREIETEPEKEADEIREIYREDGFAPEEIEIIVKRITENKSRWLSFMIREELGLAPDHFSSSLKPAFWIGISFFFGALVPVIPYLFVFHGIRGVLISGLVTLFALFAVGAGKTRLTKTSWIAGGLEMLLVGIFTGGIGFLVGKLLSLAGLNPGHA